MNSSPRASFAVLAAAVIAILEALLLLFSSGVGFLILLLTSGQLEAAQFPVVARPLALLFTGLFIALSVFGILTGIGLVLLRKWARVSILIWGGLSVFFGFFGALIGFLMPPTTGPEMPALPAGTEQTVRTVLLLIYGLPTVIGAWWLFLFNTQNIKEQFAGTVASPVPTKPRLPLPISILAWLNITTGAHVLLLPFVPFSLPLVLFGHFFFGIVATVMYVLLCAMLVSVGIGLLKLKPWSYTALIAFCILGLASGLVTAFSPDYRSQMAALQQKLLAAMHLPAEVPMLALSLGRWPLYLGLVISLAVLGLVFYYRRRFLDACAASARQLRTAQAAPEHLSS